MTQDSIGAAQGEGGAIHEIPRLGLIDAIQNLISMGGGRVDMRGPLQELSRKHGPVVMQAVGPMRSVNLFGPEANRFVLLDRDRVFSAKRPWTMIMGRIFPNGLLLRDGEDHKHHRKIMHTGFKRPALRQYVERMNPMIDAALTDWGRAEGDLMAFPAIKQLTFDMACTIFLGAQLGEKSRALNRAFEDMVAASMSRIRLPIPGLEFQRGLNGRELMKSALADLMVGRREGAESDMLSRLCRAETEEGDRFDDSEIIDHMIFLMMAAHDTTTSTLSSLAYLLARHPEWQERVREESAALPEGGLSFEDQDRLEALSLVFRETLRMFPPLPVIPRIANEDVCFAGYRVPANSLVVVSPIHTHYMEEWWTDPMTFDPDRFSPARAEHERHTHCWVPFGGGPHHCIGLRFAELQVKAVVHQWVRRYRWTVADGYEMPVQQAPISKPRDGLPIRLTALR